MNAPLDSIEKQRAELQRLNAEIVTNLDSQRELLDQISQLENPDLPIRHVVALVTLTVVPSKDQSAQAATADMTNNLIRSITGPIDTFMTDYGADIEKARLTHTANNEDPLCWGGYSGPYVVDTTMLTRY